MGQRPLTRRGAFALRQFYRDSSFDGPLQGFLYVVTLQFLPYLVRGLLLAGLGTGL